MDEWMTIVITERIAKKEAGKGQEKERASDQNEGTHISTFPAFSINFGVFLQFSGVPCFSLQL